MERIYTPWRMQYVNSNKKKAKGCVFCAKLNANTKRDHENYMVYRGKLAFAAMNIYPYNTGHLMILPHQHVSTLAEVSHEAQIEMIMLASYFTELLSQVLKPDGFNVGINLGKSAGAGLGSHLHMHIVPRWSDDSNFMTVVGNTRVLPELLDDTYEKILAAVQENPPYEEQKKNVSK